jgi:hypothetical protein
MASKTDIPAARAEHGIADLLIAGAGALTLAFIALFLCVAPLTNAADGRDFVVFWATGQQLVHHASPYDRDAMMRLERSVGFPAEDGVPFMRNLPWCLPLAFPLGFIGPRAGSLLWSLALLASLLYSVRILWRMHGRPRNSLHWLGVSFAPAVLCLMMGQTSLFALLGYVLFLDLHQRHPLTAGISLWLCALKPHLFLPLGVVLLAWILVSKSYKILAGAVAAIAASSAVISIVAPSAWVNYAVMMRTAGIEGSRIPCLSVALRFWISPQTVWLTYVPVVLGCAWALSYFWPRRHTWDWMENGSLLMLVSLVTAPYSWFYDDCLAISALLHRAYLTRSRLLLLLLLFASILTEIEFLCGVKIYSSLYLWTAPAWLAWYLCACAFTGKPQADCGCLQAEPNGPAPCVR